MMTLMVKTVTLDHHPHHLGKMIHLQEQEPLFSNTYKGETERRTITQL